MYELLIRLMLLVALGQLGISLMDLQNCQSTHCWKRLEQHKSEILAVDWQPISVFPEEAQRFR
jgi:hypothetical protein